MERVTLFLLLKNFRYSCPQMKKTNRWIGALFLSLSITHSAFAHGDGEIGIESDSGIHGPKYEKIVDELKALANAHPTLTDLFYYGLSIQGRPLVGLKVQKKSLPSMPGSKAVFINGSIHGNEYLNIEDRLPRWILENGTKDATISRFLNDGGAIYLVPILNPDGYASRERANKNGRDLNRDFTVQLKGHVGFVQPETKALSEFLVQELNTTARKLSLSMDYHCCIGAVLRPWSFITNDPPASDLAKFDVVGKILINTFGNQYQYGTTPKILGYQAVGTSKDYYYERYGTVALTFEGVRNKEDKRFNEHTKMWISLFDALNQGLL